MGLKRHGQSSKWLPFSQEDFTFNAPLPSQNAKDEAACADIGLNLVTSGLRGLHDVREDSNRQLAFLLANGYLSNASEPFGVVVKNAIREVWMEA